MAVRTLDQIVAELRPTYDPQVKSLQERAGLIPQQIQAEEQGLNAKKDVAFGDILDGARRRGLGFAGIPLAEQARYTSTDYLPALARLRQSGQERAQSLQDAILGINERRDTMAQQIRQGEVQRDYDAQQNELNRRAQRAASASASASPTLGDLARLLGGGDGGARPQMQRRKDGGFNFTDPYGTPINAAEYVQLQNSMGNRITYRNLLQQMATSGDKGARTALNYVGDDFRFNPNAPQNLIGLFRAIGADGSFSKPAPKPTPYNPNSGYTGNAIRRMF